MPQKNEKTYPGGKAVTKDGKKVVSSAANIQWVETAERLAFPRGGDSGKFPR